MPATLNSWVPVSPATWNERGAYHHAATTGGGVHVAYVVEDVTWRGGTTLEDPHPMALAVRVSSVGPASCHATVVWTPGYTSCPGAGTIMRFARAKSASMESIATRHSDPLKLLRSSRLASASALAPRFGASPGSI